MIEQATSAEERPAAFKAIQSEKVDVILSVGPSIPWDPDAWRKRFGDAPMLRVRTTTPL